MNLSFFVVGRAQQRGSKIPQVIYRDGKPVMKNGRPIVIARDQNDDKSFPWMQEVRSVAMAAKLQVGILELVRDPVEIYVTFYFNRPKSHYGTGKNECKLRDSAPLYHSQTPDLDKLCRCFGDALSGVLISDDRQIASWYAKKSWTTECEGTEVLIKILGVNRG